MTDRLSMLLEGQVLVTKYSELKPWRPGLVDLWVYDTLIDMHESDYEDVEAMSWLWRETPDNIMSAILENDVRFDLEYGPEQMHEEIRDYLQDKGFIVDVEDVDDEEYTKNLEGRK